MSNNIALFFYDEMSYYVQKTLFFSLSQFVKNSDLLPTGRKVLFLNMFLNASHMYE